MAGCFKWRYNVTVFLVSMTEANVMLRSLLRWRGGKVFLTSFMHGCGAGPTSTKMNSSMWSSASTPLTWSTITSASTPTTTRGWCRLASVRQLHTTQVLLSDLALANIMILTPTCCCCFWCMMVTCFCLLSQLVSAFRTQVSLIPWRLQSTCLVSHCLPVRPLGQALC